MRIFKTKRFVRLQKVADESLLEASAEMMAGLIDVNLGGGLYKKRVAAKGRGKRGSYRTLLTFRSSDRLIFLYIFAKNEQENIGLKEQEVFKKLAAEYLRIDNKSLDILVKHGELVEIKSRSLDYEEKQEKESELIGSRARNGAGVV